MLDFRKLQKDVYQNKVDKGFNTTDVNKEFCLTYAELAEAYDAWLKKKDDVGEELADVVIFTMGLSEILGVDLESEIINKINKNFFYYIYSFICTLYIKLYFSRFFICCSNSCLN